MIEIRSPQHDADQDSRFLDCQDAVEFAFHRLIADAELRGWRAAEIALAMADVAEEYIISLANGSVARH